jgi:hypothetical protein
MGRESEMQSGVCIACVMFLFWTGPSEDGHGHMNWLRIQPWASPVNPSGYSHKPSARGTRLATSGSGGGSRAPFRGESAHQAHLPATRYGHMRGPSTRCAAYPQHQQLAHRIHSFHMKSLMLTDWAPHAKPTPLQEDSRRAPRWTGPATALAGSGRRQRPARAAGSGQRCLALRLAKAAGVATGIRADP